MENAATSVRINADAARILSQLALQLETSRDKVLEIALKDLEDRIFWADVHRPFERTAAVQSDNPESELRIWESASETDFRDEKW